jgi:hypothetical protein
MTPPFLVAPNLGGARHGFFGREGGVSTGMFRSLNAGLGSADAHENAAENRRRCADALGAHALLTLTQVHSSDAVIVTDTWQGQGPRADAMATRMKGVALGVLAADCMPFLFHDEEAGVIGAAHAGWKGALAGVLESAIDAMERMGARPERINAALGPCLRRDNFEVGLDLVEAFAGKYPYAERFFHPDRTPEKRRFDLAAFGRWRLAEKGVARLSDLEACTLEDPERWFSYRASRRAGEPDYGRNLSAIVLPRGD